MKLYDSRLAPNPRRVRWFMAEKGITDIEIDAFDLFEGRQKTKAYLEEVGVPNVPALVLDNGDAITELVAICRYLESLYPEPNLFGLRSVGNGSHRDVAAAGRAADGLPLDAAVRHGHPALAALETQVPALSEANKAQAVALARPVRAPARNGRMARRRSDYHGRRHPLHRLRVRPHGQVPHRRGHSRTSCAGRRPCASGSWPVRGPKVPAGTVFGPSERCRDHWSSPSGDHV